MIRTSTLVVLAAGLSCPPLTAQASPETSLPPTFGDRVEVSVIELDVGVSDRQGRPIEGLTKGAFSVYEDGRQVELVGFEEVLPPAAARAAGHAPAVRALPPPAADIDTRYLAIWVDVAATDAIHRNRSLRQLIASLEAGAFSGWWTAVAAFDGDIELLQPFTTDIDATIAALRELEVRSGKPSAGEREWHSVVADLQRMARELGCTTGKDLMVARARDYHHERHHEIDGSLRALGEFINSLGGLPSQKEVLVLSEGLAVRPGEELYALIGDWCGDHRLQLEGQGLSGLTSLDDLAALASHRRVRLHPVDLAGVGGYGPHDVSVGGGGATVSSTVVALRRANQREVPVVLAQRSGGHAILDTNDLGPALEQLSLEIGHHYRLAYRPRRDGDEREHRLRVEVARPGATVHHRRTHKDRSGAARLADRTLSTLWYDLEHNPLGVELSFDTPRDLAPGFWSVPARLRIPLASLSLVPNGGVYLGQLELLAASRDSRGRRSVPERFAVTLRLSAEDLQRGHVTQQIDLTLRDLASAVALTVFDAFGGTGSYLLRTLPPATPAPASNDPGR